MRYDPPFDLSGPSEGRHSPDTRRASQAGIPVGENPKRGGDSVPEEEYEMTGRYAVICVTTDPDRTATTIMLPSEQ